MKLGDWEFIEVRRDENKDPPRKSFDMIFYECIHTPTGKKIERSIIAYKPFESGKLEEFLKTIADEMSQFDFIRLEEQ